MAIESKEAKELQTLIQEGFKSMQLYLDVKFKEVHDKIDSLAVMEQHTNKDIITVLSRVERQTAGLNRDIEHLAGKLAVQELKLNRLDN